MSGISVRLEDHFRGLTDPRRRRPTYPLVNILVMALCAVLSGADDFVSIAHWANTKKPWLARFLDLSAGVPSHDRFNAIFAALNPAEFEKCLLGWITALHEVTDGQVIAIDGKTLRRSFDAATSKAAIHMVCAWATTNHVTLGQVVTGVSATQGAENKLQQLAARLAGTGNAEVSQLLQLIDTCVVGDEGLEPPTSML